MRIALPLLAAAAAAVAAALAGGAGSAGAAGVSRARCPHPAWATVTENREIVVRKHRNRHGDEAYVCHKRSGRWEYLASSDGLEVDFLRDAELAGRSVGWAVNARDNDPDSSPGRVSLVYSLRYYPPGTHPRWRGWTGQPPVSPPGPRYRSRVGSVAVRPNTSVGWIACPPRSAGRRACNAPGRQVYVYYRRVGAKRRTLVTKGRNIDPDSLRRRGKRLVWTQGGRPRSAPFAP